MKGTQPAPRMALGGRTVHPIRCSGSRRGLLASGAKRSQIEWPKEIHPPKKRAPVGAPWKMKMWFRGLGAATACSAASTTRSAAARAAS